MGKAWIGCGMLSVVLLFSACGEDREGDRTEDPQAALEHHGDVAIQFLRAANESSSPYTAVEMVSITLHYLECLSEFYEAEPAWRQDGPLGAPVFEDWLGHECGPQMPECSIVSIEQNFEVSPPQITSTYDIRQDLENRELFFGPLPDAELAGCTPVVRLGREDAIVGTDLEGNVVMRMESFNPDTAATGQGQEISIRAGAAP